MAHAHDYLPPSYGGLCVAPGGRSVRGWGTKARKQQQGEWVDTEPAILDAGTRVEMTTTGGPAICTCGVLAVGRCSRCANPFCETHNYGRRYTLCSTCGPVQSDESLLAFAKAVAQHKPWDEVAQLVQKLIAAAPDEAVDVYRVDVERSGWPKKRMRENYVKVDHAWPLGEQEVERVGEKDRTVYELRRVALRPNGELASFSEDRGAYFVYLGNSPSPFESLDPPKSVWDVLNEDAVRLGIVP